MAETRKRQQRSSTPGDPAASPWAVRHRRPRDHELKRDAVVRAAAQAFNARGYHNTSLDDIAAALGITKPTVYYYVSNKEQLLFECFRAGLQRIREAFREAQRSDRPARERLNSVVRGYAEAIASEYGWCMVRAHEHDLGPELGRQINALKSEIDQGIRRLLREGVEDGSLGPCDPKLTAFAMAGALNWIAHWYRENQPMNAAQVADAFASFFENGLLPRPARQPATRG
jgi:AcrR family transcriptional regulator